MTFKSGFVAILGRPNVGTVSYTHLNLVDFDALYGHRRNAHGYRDCLHEFDERLSLIHIYSKPLVAALKRLSS